MKKPLILLLVLLSISTIGLLLPNPVKATSNTHSNDTRITHAVNTGNYNYIYLTETEYNNKMQNHDYIVFKNMMIALPLLIIVMLGIPFLITTSLNNKYPTPSIGNL